MASRIEALSVENHELKQEVSRLNDLVASLERNKAAASAREKNLKAAVSELSRWKALAENQIWELKQKVKLADLNVAALKRSIQYKDLSDTGLIVQYLEYFPNFHLDARADMEKPAPPINLAAFLSLLVRFRGDLSPFFRDPDSDNSVRDLAEEERAAHYRNTVPIEY
jgi:hypothetical protein